MIKKIVVVGAGPMGSGVAHVAALHDFPVTLIDVDADQLGAAMQVIEHNLSRQVTRGKITEERKASALAKITTSQSLGDVKGSKIVIEAATENEEIKRQIYKEIIPFIDDDTIIATNTSTISITRLAAATDRPEKFIGTHFMNPVPVMQLIEIIRGIATDDKTFRTICDLAIKLGKTPAVSEDFPAFIVNRILLPMVNEAIYTLYEGVGSVEAIDTAIRLGANHPMGPLELADFIGLDTCLAIMTMLYDGLADSKYRPCPLLVKYVEAGWLGRRAGRGFYDYSGETPVPTR